MISLKFKINCLICFIFFFFRKNRFWPNLTKLDQIWPNTNFGQIWSNLVKFDFLNKNKKQTKLTKNIVCCTQRPWWFGNENQKKIEKYIRQYMFSFFQIKKKQFFFVGIYPNYFLFLYLFVYVCIYLFLFIFHLSDKLWIYQK